MLIEQLSVFACLLLLTAIFLQRQSVFLLLLGYLNSSFFKVILLKKGYFSLDINLLLVPSN